MKNIMELANNKQFIEKLAQVENAEQLESLFSTEGIELESGMTYEQAFNTLKHAADEELEEDELEYVSGGFAWGAAIGIGVLIYFGYKYLKGAKKGWDECH